MEKLGDKTPAQLEAEETAQWIKDHADSLDYPDVPEDRGYRIDDSKLSPEVQKAIAERMAYLKKHPLVKKSG